MAKMTMHQELDMLRLEVEELRKQKEEREKTERAEAIKAEEVRQQNIEEAEEETAEEIMETVGGVRDDAKEGLHDLLDTIKKDYENLSPVVAVVLFALGAAFGRALDPK